MPKETTKPTEEQLFLARIANLPADALLPTEADEAEARALIYDYRQAIINQENTIDVYEARKIRFVG